MLVQTHIRRLLNPPTISRGLAAQKNETVVTKEPDRRAIAQLDLSCKWHNLVFCPTTEQFDVDRSRVILRMPSG
ncbi:MAG: hypothetical protein KME17_01515 [Cyanosarcina radialis HA8281-LM2]|jgi:hypothetical protein|nr:hypothetical protein [Cyanosarcina radialis HA8281-LM2]